MSMTESKAPTKGKTTRPAKTTKKNALTEKIEAALAKAVRKTATLGQLVLTDLNVRKKKSSQVSIEGLAAAIRSAGLLMNLAVFEMDDGRYGVVAGERRTLAQQVAEDEGWSWAEGRISAIKMWGEDAEIYRELAEPQPEFTADEQAEIKRLKARFSELEAAFEAADADTDTHVLNVESDAVQADIARLTAQVIIRSWPPAMRSSGGVVASLRDGEVVYQRGIVLRASEATTGNGADDNGEGTATSETAAPKTKEKGLSSALITSLSAERTLAVMGALVENPTVALALHTHPLAVKVFGSRYAGSLLQTSLTLKRGELLSKAPTAEGSRADRQLGELHAQWEAKLPPEWNTDFTWLLTWEQAEVVALLSYCVGLSLDAVHQWPAGNGKVGDALTPLEHALDFTLRDWWQPTKANYFGRISKELMSDALLDGGKVAQAASVLKMKKGDAAQLAEDELTASGWVPECLLPVGEDTTTLQGADNSAAA
ncbi:ParB N-terminal domain-containing protein [Serratia marcescens]|uniref:ParB N-terminal domain-containing protein n=1 Tax=Serratia marcescens TaxID=615 RepID=UPI003ED98E06